jgi:hypothetical protein
MQRPLAALSMSFASFAQVHNVALPTSAFGAPPLVVLQPGVQVVEVSDDEVCFVDGWDRRGRDDARGASRLPPGPCWKWKKHHDDDLASGQDDETKGKGEEG